MVPPSEQFWEQDICEKWRSNLEEGIEIILIIF
jgi:hypothetical protein